MSDRCIPTINVESFQLASSELKRTTPGDTEDVLQTLSWHFPSEEICRLFIHLCINFLYLQKHALCVNVTNKEPSSCTFFSYFLLIPKANSPLLWFKPISPHSSPPTYPYRFVSFSSNSNVETSPRKVEFLSDVMLTLTGDHKGEPPDSLRTKRREREMKE